MSEIKGYKITLKTLSVARVALFARERQLMDWLALEPETARLRSVIEWELVEVRAAIEEMKVL